MPTGSSSTSCSRPHVPVRPVVTLPQPVLTTPARPVGTVDDDARAPGRRPGRHHAGLPGLRRPGRPPDRGGAPGLRGGRHRPPQGALVPRHLRPLRPRAGGRPPTPRRPARGACSVPDLTGDVARATRVTVTGLDEDRRPPHAGGGRLRGPGRPPRARPPRRPGLSRPDLRSPLSSFPVRCTGDRRHAPPSPSDRPPLLPPAAGRPGLRGGRPRGPPDGQLRLPDRGPVHRRGGDRRPRLRRGRPAGRAGRRRHAVRRRARPPTTTPTTWAAT